MEDKSCSVAMNPYTGEELPFEIVMSKSQYFNTENIETEIQ